jgi:hypothetical protein
VAQRQAGSARPRRLRQAALDFRWDRYAHLLIDDEYLRKEGLLWLSELRTKPNFPKIVRVLAEPRVTSHRPRST